MCWFFSTEKVLMCEAGVTNAEPSEDNSISAFKVSKVAIAKGRLDRIQLVGSTSIPLSLPESLTMDSQIVMLFVELCRSLSVVCLKRNMCGTVTI